MSDSAAIDDRLQQALAVSEQAERLVMSYYQDAALRVDLKADQSPVTAADRGAEELLRAELLKAFPDDAVLGEEFGETPGGSGYRWILDPVDGTKSFVHGVPLFGMLIGLQFRGDPVAGICRLPALGEMVYARRGGGAFWQRGSAAPERARVSQTAQLSEALCCFTALEGFAEISRMDVPARLSGACRLSRGWGDCYGHVLVASGRADVMIDPLLAEWDASALIPIVEEAGGVFMDWTGRRTAVGGNGVSTTPALKSSVLKLLQTPASRGLVVT
jgi:histidinol phosphatase-like enzyme (inositol monophosphatase family)